MNKFRFWLGMVIVMALGSSSLRGQQDIGTVFTYQGTLENGDGPVTAFCDFRFGLWKDPDSMLPEDQVGSLQSALMVDVAGGVFTTTIDFGTGSIDGTARWLEIEVCCPNPCDPAFTLLEPRVELMPAPHALALPGLYTEQHALSPNIIGGFNENEARADVYGATIGGGGGSMAPNRVTSHFGTIGGGANNEAGDAAFPVIFRPFATVGGGTSNTASGNESTVGGGAFNTASGNESTVGGGSFNVASGFGATVAGGTANVADGQRSIVPGGQSNLAGGDYSFAAGYQAKVRDDDTTSPYYSGDASGDEGTFIWADSTAVDLVSTGPNQFLIRAAGGVGINTNDPDVELEIAGGTELTLADGTGYLMIGDQDQVNLALDTDEIQARNDGAASNLLLNPAGGSVGIGIAPTDPLTVAGVIRSTTGGFELPDGTIIDAANDLGTGDITAVTAGTGLTGGGTSGSVTLNVAYSGTGAATTSARSDHYHSSLAASDGNPLTALSVDATGRVGIGEPAPGWELEVQGSIAATNPGGSPDGSSVRLTSPSADPGITMDLGDGLGAVAQTWAIKIETGGDLEIHDDTANLDRLVIEAVTGEVGIGTVSPSAELHVVGDIVYTGTITDISDERLKQNIAPVKNATSKIQQLRGVYFNMTDTPDQRDVGLIAQDVQAVLPEAVRVVDPENGYLGVAYPSVIPLLVEAIKETQSIMTAADSTRTAAISELRQIVQEKDCEIDDLRFQISELKAIVKALVAQNGGGE